MIRHRLRGILGTTIAVSIPWTLIGILVGVAFQFDLIPGVHAGLDHPIPGGLLTACTLAGMLVGVVNGLTFSGLVLAAERGKNVEELQGWRFATWGAAATAGTLGLLIHTPLAAGIGAGIGAVAGFAALWAVRRARAATAAHTDGIL